MYYVYKLICPKTNNVRYIGMCTDTLRRYIAHCGTTSMDNPYKTNWVLRLKMEGKKPIMRVIATYKTKKGAAYRERSEIANFLELGASLFNNDSCFITKKRKPRKITNNVVKHISQINIEAEKAAIVKKLEDKTLTLGQIANGFGISSATLISRIKEYGLQGYRRQNRRKNGFRSTKKEQDEYRNALIKNFQS